MNNEHIHKIAKNMVDMDGDPSTVTERIKARDDAVSEVVAALLATKHDDEALTDEERRSIEWAVDYVYRAGHGEFIPDDIARHVEIDAGYRVYHKDATNEWVPETAEAVQSVIPYIQLVSRLSYEDKVPAFGASQQGRPHEITDNPDDVYNKYGERVTHLQR